MQRKTQPQPAVWNLKGRQAVASLDPTTRYRIVHSHVMTKCANKPLLWVLEELTTIECVGGLSGPTQKVEYFLCLVVRLLQICPSPELVLTMLRQDLHKYVRVAAMVVIRLIGHADMMNEAVSIGLDDYRKVRIYGDEDGVPAAALSGKGGSTNPFATTSASPVLSLSGNGPSKRLGSGVNSEETKRAEQAEVEALMNLPPSHYFIWHLDEVTERLFGLSRTSQSATSFLGVPLPPLVEELRV